MKHPSLVFGGKGPMVGGGTLTRLVFYSSEPFCPFLLGSAIDSFGCLSFK